MKSKNNNFSTQINYLSDKIQLAHQKSHQCVLYCVTYSTVSPFLNLRGKGEIPKQISLNNKKNYYGKILYL